MTLKNVQKGHGRPKDMVKETLDSLEKYGATPDQLLAALDELYKDCKTGYTQQKQTAKGAVVELKERDMKTALNCIEAKYAIVKDLMRQYDPSEEAKDYQFTLTVLTKPVEVPKSTEGSSSSNEDELEDF